MAEIQGMQQYCGAATSLFIGRPFSQGTSHTICGILDKKEVVPHVV